MQDLNLRPLACHAHISCSPPLSDVQISRNRSTFCPLSFADVRSNFLGLLTNLLTECLCNLRKGSSISIRESYRKEPISWSKSVPRDSTLFRQQPVSNAQNFNESPPSVSSVPATTFVAHPLAKGVLVHQQFARHVSNRPSSVNDAVCG